MLAAQRKQTILEMLEKEGSVRTISLSERLEVTDETIRRDLDLLAAENLVERTHGGAIRVMRDVSELPYDARRVRNLAEKKAVAREAAKLLEPGDTIYMDASSTSLQMAGLLGDKPLRVITNAHLILNLLSQHDRIKLISTGGNLNRRNYGFEGPAALRALERYRIDKVFCSGNGIDAKFGLTEINEWQSHLKEVAMGRSSHNCFLADSSKLGVHSTFCFGSCADLHHLITTEKADSKLVKPIGQAGPKVAVVSTKKL